MKTFYLKVHESVKGRIVSICDKDLIGKKFEEKELQLEISEKFYKGILVDEEEVIKVLKNERNINLVGENTIKVAKKLDLAENIKTIKNIPHMEIFEL
ncbi:MAG: DUF424 family protein [Candidatus Nanoarchaeia archaeon]|nr:DUF424 family protein [Candidatus Nanoarchaeia archaeon]MDD5587762.1 DUF424 family protein [Candidatus Nanoarchaeia archaeon]